MSNIIQTPPSSPNPTYLDLLRHEGITGVHTVQQVNNWNTGYHIYREYLKQYLEANGVTMFDESIIINMPDTGNSFLPYHLNAELQDDVEYEDKANRAVIVSLGFNQGGPVISHQLREAIAPFKMRIFVAHDIKWAQGLMGEHPQFHKDSKCLDWSPAFYNRYGVVGGMDGNLPNAYLKLVTIPNSWLILPSAFMMDTYLRAFAEYKVDNEFPNLALIPHPMEDLLALYKHCKINRRLRGKTILMSSPYKSDPLKYFSFIQEALAGDWRIKIPSPNDSVDPEWFAPYISSGRLDVINPCSHAQLLYELGRTFCYVDWSHYQESFGFMVREASAMGAHVISSGYGALAETEAGARRVDFVSQAIAQLDSFLVEDEKEKAE